MNIKQAEKLSGVSRRNIRFYEQEGLITPGRNRENDYREYSEEDIEVLKKIRVFRMVDMPLEQIRDVLQGRAELKDAADAQKEKLKAKTRELEKAIRFCEEFASISRVDSLDTDAVLRRMEAPENREGLFTQWVDDYKRFARAQQKKTYTFYPEEEIEHANDVTMALFRYADENKLDMVITKEGMNPRLIINGYEYIAEVIYTRWGYVPVTMIQCHAVHPEILDPSDIPDGRKRVLRVVRSGIPYVLATLIYCLLFGQMLSNWEGWLILAGILFFVRIAVVFGWPVSPYRKQFTIQKTKKNGRRTFRIKVKGEENE